MTECAALSEAMAPPRPSMEVADVLRMYGEKYGREHSLNYQQRKAIRDIQACRTAALGGHVDVCEQGCGYHHISYNSCRNRHCPKCQGLQSARWLAKRYDRILPTHYFHMVFTVPHELHPIMLQNPQILYKLLFRAAAQSLFQLAKQWKHLEAEVGFTAILHTWNQDMLFHPHLHVLVTGGGLDRSQTRWISSRKNFLVPVRALSKKFRGKFIDLLKKAFTGNQLNLKGNVRHLRTTDALERLMNKLYRKKWVVYCKQPFGGPEGVFKYLGLYTHRVAISNHRLVEMIGDTVTFLARDNKNPGKKRFVSVPPQEFIRRFLVHILPTGFVKIRHYGLMAPRNVKTKLQMAKKLIEQTPVQALKRDLSSDDNQNPDPQTSTWTEIFFHITRIDLGTCPECGGNLVRRPLTILDQLSAAIEEDPLFLDSS